MLSGRDYTITSIAFNVGFQELRTFERAFKNYTGMTAQAFKKLVQPGQPRTVSRQTRKMTEESLQLPVL